MAFVLERALWRGEVSLAAAFWLFGVIGVSLVGGLVVAWMSYQHRVFLETQFGLLFASCFLGFLVLYAVLVAVAIWRSSNKYRGLKRLAVLAKIWAILMVLRTLEVVPALFLGA